MSKIEQWKDTKIQKKKNYEQRNIGNGKKVKEKKRKEKGKERRKTVKKKTASLDSGSEWNLVSVHNSTPYVHHQLLCPFWQFSSKMNEFSLIYYYHHIVIILSLLLSLITSIQYITSIHSEFS